MPHPRFSGEEISRHEKKLYEQGIRAQVETDENIGKLISIDTETGDYEVGDDKSLATPRLLLAKHLGATIYPLRIGYNAVYALGGVLERTAP